MHHHTLVFLCWLFQDLETLNPTTAQHSTIHDDVIKWKHFRVTRNWSFVRGIHRSPVVFLTKASDAERWCFLWSAPEERIEQKKKNRDAGDLIRHCAPYHVIVMWLLFPGHVWRMNKNVFSACVIWLARIKMDECLKTAEHILMKPMTWTHTSHTWHIWIAFSLKYGFENMISMKCIPFVNIVSVFASDTRLPLNKKP